MYDLPTSSGNRETESDIPTTTNEAYDVTRKAREYEVAVPIRAGGRFSILIGSAGCQRALARQLGGSGVMLPQKNFDFETF